MNMFGPNPPSRKEEDFPKTGTIPEGWIIEGIMQKPSGSSDDSASQAENTRPAPVVEDESLFKRRLDPFPKPNPTPSGWDLSSIEES
jgi:hypothetical protein